MHSAPLPKAALIPAKAGTHSPDCDANPVFAAPQPWVPAFAGMTALEWRCVDGS
jgi:hypothetical protein